PVTSCSAAPSTVRPATSRRASSDRRRRRRVPADESWATAEPVNDYYSALAFLAFVQPAMA
ncbi:MAG: hypothetical protein ACXWYT_03585, partial [Actinomycetota bacterium]